MKNDNKTKTKKRKLVDEKILHDQTLITSIEELPSKEYDIPDFVEPLDNSIDLNKDSSIVFEIKTKDNEYFYFNKNFQAQIEMSVTQQEFEDDGTAGNVVLLHKMKRPDATANNPDPENPNTFEFVPSTSGLSIFKNIAVSYMNHTKDESLTFPQEGVFLNNLTAQDFFLSGSEDFEKIQRSLNNYTINNNVRLGDDQTVIPDWMEKIRYSKLHKNKTDAPKIDGVADNAQPTCLVGKMHYLYISRTPFVANNPYMQAKYNLQDVIVFPPNSTVRIVFYKNENALKYLGINKEVDMPEQSANAPKGTVTWTRKNIKYHIHKMHLVIHRVKVDPKHQVPPRHLSNITVNHFDLIELTTATSQKIPINWRSKDTPAYLVLSFMRQQDVILSEAHGLSQAVNQFFLPTHLSSLTVRQQDYINEVFDGLKIENLDKQDYHKSKQEYIEYLKKHKFVPPTFSFHDMFTTDPVFGTGCCNLFPIDLIGRNIQADPQNRGLEVELNYTSPNTTKWFLAVRVVFIGQQIMTRQTDRQYKVDFKYY